MKTNRQGFGTRLGTAGVWVALAICCVCPATAAEKDAKQILLIAGPPSHGPGLHEFPAGAGVLAESLNNANLPVRASVSVGWPADESLVAGADLIVIYSDGLGDHVARGRAAALRARMEEGKGLAVLHFALEPPEDDGELRALFDEALGGRFEANWSVNPVWKLAARPDAEHPVSRGVGPLDIEDEWYFHLRFRDGAPVRPVLYGRPAAGVLGADGPRSGNPVVRAALERGEPQLLAWTHEASGGARGFGFTGGHFHRNWYDGDFRRLVLNGIVWAAGIEVPAGGVEEPGPAEPLYATIDEAIARGDVDDVGRHLGKAPEAIDGREGARMTPIQQAILRRRTEIALLLIERGADVNAPDSSLRTPLHLAVERGDAVIVGALLKKGADPARRDKIGWTPLHHAAAKDQLEIARMLLDAGLDPNVRSERGGTPLHEAAASGGAGLVKLLLARGTDPSVRSASGVTALDIAREFKNEAAIAVLEKVALKE